jgi:hypothetical protein
MTPVSAVSAVAAFALLALCAAATAAAARVTPALSVVRRWGKQVEAFLAPEGDFRVFYGMEGGQPIPAEKGQLLKRDGYVEWTFRDEKGNRYNAESTVVIPFGAGLAFNDTVTLKMEWLTVPTNDTWKSDAECKASKGGTVEVQENLRCPAGTGDFRVGLFDSGGGASALRGMANWRGWQVRFAPHLAAIFADKPGRDDMSNASQWFRTPPSTRDGLLDDWCQSTRGYAPGSKPSISAAGRQARFITLLRQVKLIRNSRSALLLRLGRGIMWRLGCSAGRTTSGNRRSTSIRVCLARLPWVLLISQPARRLIRWIRSRLLSRIRFGHINPCASGTSGSSPAARVWARVWARARLWVLPVRLWGRTEFCGRIEFNRSGSAKKGGNTASGRTRAGAQTAPRGRRTRYAKKHAATLALDVSNRLSLRSVNMSLSGR